jgi:hypothetical protein
MLALTMATMKATTRIQLAREKNYMMLVTAK